jgi:hypothetical protein
MQRSSFFAGTIMIAVLGKQAATAQQVTGVPGSAGATTTLDGKQLPPPYPKFCGMIQEKAWESKAWWSPRVVPPKGDSMKNSTPVRFPEDETFDIGQDTRTGVALLEYRYEPPFKFAGTMP